MALIVMGAVIAAAGVFVPVEDKLGPWTTVGLLAFPLLAAVATKAAKIASEKEGDTSIGSKFKDSFNDAMRAENVAELLLWFVAWVSGGLGIFLLSNAIEMW